jgi:hypothetical protein
VASAGTWLAANDNTIQAMKQNYDDVTNQLDRVSSGGTAGFGPGVPLMNNYILINGGRPAVLVPAMLGSSGFAGDNTAGAMYDWTPYHPFEANGISTRSGLLGSAIARVKALQALGGTLRFVVWEDGEAAATGGSVSAAAYQAHAKAVLDFVQAQTGCDRFIIQQIYATMTGGTAPNIATVQAGQAALAVAHKRLVSAPATLGLEADNIHRNAASHLELYGPTGHIFNLINAEPSGSGWY